MAKEKRETEVSHGELVQRIANALEELEGKEMTELWNGMFPTTPVRYMGDSMYEWVEEEKPIPKCPNCNGEVELADGDAICHFCGYQGQPIRW